MSEQYCVAVLGATGAVGQEFLRLFEERKFPIGELRLLASERSAGSTLGGHIVQAAQPDQFDGVDVAFFSAGAGRSREFAPIATQRGALVVDNSSAFRMDPEVPLVVPEVNFHAVTPQHRVIANPNCTAAILLMALAPLDRLSPIERIVVSTYQSASGAGAAAMLELQTQSADVLAGRPAEPKIFKHPCAFNVFSHDSAMRADGFNEEEQKVGEECRKILGRPDLRVNATCVRVPVLRAHSESVTIEFAGERPSVEQAREALLAAPGVRLVDDREANHFPMPIEAGGGDDVLVGRIRLDPSHPRGMSLFVSGDQLLKGAALNAVQIAERCIEAGWV